MNPASEQKRIAFGYMRKNGEVQLYPGEASCVQLIFNYYDEGKSFAEIKEILEGMNIPSPYNKRNWGKQTLSNILSNPHYLGSEEYPKIIDQDLYYRVQQRKDRFKTKK